MTTSDELWIGQNGKRYGPYTEAVVRQWHAEGKLDGDALAWREGMPAWMPLSGLLSAAVSHPPPPPGAADFRPAEKVYATEPFSSPRYGEADSPDRDRAELPPPPSLHWGLLLLLGVVTFGIFALVWPFIQAGWIRRIDARSKARLLLALAFTAFVVGEIFYVFGLVSLRTGGAGLALIGALLLLLYAVLFIVAYFSMAGSLRRNLAPYGLPVEIGGVTLFFFNMYYLQAQLRWIARWKATGQTVPKPSKGVFWLFFLLVPFVFGILAAIAIPAYQNYLVRAQVAEGMILADNVKASVTGYYVIHHAAPADNAAVGLGPISARYVSSIDVAGGKITVAFDTTSANVTIRDKVLVLSPTLGAGQITWNCSTETTLPNSDLPVACRR